jgi:hypothetical protein
VPAPRRPPWQAGRHGHRPAAPGPPAAPVTSRAQLRRAALDLAETLAREDGSFAVAGRRFAALDGGAVVLCLAAGDLAEFRAAFAEAVVADAGVRLDLARIDGQRLNHWVRRAWLAQAPPGLVARAAAADAAVAGGVGDLPKGIGGPASRALANAGITTLAQVAGMSDAALLAMHGVGPKAVRVLRAALAG